MFLNSYSMVFYLSSSAFYNPGSIPRGKFSEKNVNAPRPETAARLPAAEIIILKCLQYFLILCPLIAGRPLLWDTFYPTSLKIRVKSENINS